MLLYRFVDLAGLVAIVANRQMFLRQVTAWLDKFETGAFKHLVGEVVLEKTHLAIRDPSPAKSVKVTELRNLIREAIIDLNAQSIYAQSWSKSESEGLWYRYGADQKSIRLTVELESILSAIKTRWPRVEHFDVEYCSSDDAYIRVLDRFNAGDTNITSCRRYKRPEFRYEEEYRFCLFQAPKGYENIDLYSFDFNEENDLKKALNGLQGYQPDNVKEYDFNPELIKEITLDPRLDPKTQDWFERAIRNLCKAQGMPTKVTQSKLYTNLTNSPNARYL